MEPRPDTDDLKQLAPTLASLPKADPFVVPDGLFERFSHQVQGLVSKPERRAGWAPWAKRLAFVLPLVALATGAWWMLRKDDVPTPEVAVEIPAATVDELELLDHPEAFAELAGETSIAEELPATSVDLNDDELALWLENERTDLPELIAEL